MSENRTDLLRQLPSVDMALKDKKIAPLLERYGHALVVRGLRGLLGEWRQAILSGAWQGPQVAEAVGQLESRLRAYLLRQQTPSLRPVINASGIIIHTNLGRSLLAAAARQQVAEVASTYSTLEVDVAAGGRGSRYSHVVDLLCELTGAEDALVVNNNAAAVLLVLAALGRGREVIVSRGQLVEIGGSFRIPEVMEQSGCRLVEVGTTNKTHPHDYERAIGPETALLLKVHTSNYRMIGFTEEVPAATIASIAHEHGLLAVEDLGSGVLLDLQRLNLQAEPTVQQSLAAGMDVVTFSGDKLLGGPQAGIIVGQRLLIRQIAQHPLTRAVRIDKLSLAALEATLRLYLDEACAVREIPTLRMLATSAEELQARARQWLGELAPLVGEAARLDVVESAALVGGGSLPGYELPSYAVAVRPAQMAANQLEVALRQGEPPIFARIQHDQVWFDLRTIQPGEEQQIQARLAAILQEVSQ